MVLGEMDQAQLEQNRSGSAHEDVRGGAVHVARIAFVPLRVTGFEETAVPDEASENASRGVMQAVIDALNSDPRVRDIAASVPTAAGPHNGHVRAYMKPGLDMATLASDNDVYFAMRLPRPLRFTVDVPAKNQTQWRGVGDVPATSYSVVWDGIALIVCWVGEVTATSSGGHVVLEVIDDVARAAGYGAPVVGCTTGCSHGFLHLNFVSFDDVQASDEFELVGESPTGPNVMTHWNAGASAMEDAVNLYSHVRDCLSHYAGALAFSTRIAEMGSRLRWSGQELMELNYLATVRPAWWNWSTSARTARERLGGWRRQRRLLIADMWLAVATVETILPDWQEYYARMNSELEATGLSIVGEYFNPRGVEVEQTDLSTAKQTLADVGSRTDTRQIFWATLMAGLVAASSALVAGLLV